MATIKINNWSEFVTALETEGAVVECPAGEIWDMNGVAPTGVPQINVNCSRIHGNGLIVRNLRSTAEQVFMLNANTDVYDLDFLSFYIDGGFSNVSAGTHNWHGCRFSGISTTSGVVFRGAWSDGASFDNYIASPNINKGCSFNVICHSGSLFSGYFSGANRATTKVEYGKVNFNGSKLVVEAQYYSHNARFDNCLIQGNFTTARCASFTSIFDCTCDSISDYQGFGTTIVNKDKCRSYPSSAIAVTSEQLRDAAYLRSQGFPIGVEVND